MTRGEQVLLDLLRTRYGPPQFAFIPSVRNGTGFARGQDRTADAIAMGLWPSRGLRLHGFEVKSYRGDWVRELKQPEKAEEIASRCHHWWVVAGNEEIVKPEELPPTWGLLVPRGNGLRAVREAPPLEPKPLDHLFLAAILKRAAESYVPEDEVRRRVEKAENDMRDVCAYEFKRLREAVATFETASGVKIGDGWGGERIGEAVKYVVERGPTRVLRDMEHLRDSARKIVESLDGLVAEARAGTST